MYYYDYYNCYYCVRERERERERETAVSARAAHKWRLLILFPQTSREKVYTSSYAREKKRSLLFSRLLRFSRYARKRAARYSLYISRALSKSSEE